MKRIIIAFGIIILFAGLSALSLWYLDDIHDEINVMLEECYQYGVEDRVEEAVQKSQEVFEKWHNSETFLITFIHHDQLDDITIVTSRLAPLIANGEKAEYLAEVKKAMVLVEHIKMSEQPMLKNIL
ncbi:DUF4363 family protein [Zongyangia hominis]|uniref:DUF4363 family protein n=1 Tax=Zongyangia hominis TaxID=2763677 RepID=A0A926EC41_9FIRM|nr:DUF4363 family protein [Zongyangia hominis]MBC8569514.1 DUF4363 family protein [Zongyangia hominis]